MILDMRTALLTYAIAYTLCALVMAIAWYQNRRRFAGISFWLVALAMQSVGAIMIVLRGLVPDFISIVLANTMIQAGVITLYIGLERFTGKKSWQVHNYILLALFISIQAYYTFVQPNLLARTLNVTVATAIFTFQCFWLAVRRVDPHMRQMTRVVGIAFGGEVIVSLIRIVLLVVVPLQSNDFFKSGMPETLMLIAYAVLAVGITFSLMMMLNSRLFTEIQANSELFMVEKDRFRLIADSCPDYIFEADNSGKLTYCSPAIEQVLGYKPDERIGTTITDIESDMSPGEMAETRKVFSNLLNGKTVRDMPIKLPSKSGKLVSLEISASPVFRDGEFTSLVGVARDITERRQLEKALLFTRFSLDNAADTMACIDHEARFVDVNSAFCRAVGYSREELLSMRVHDIDPDYSAEVWPEFWKKLKQSGSLIFETYHRSKEGRIIPVEIVANYFEYEGKEYHCAFARDITERKQAEEELRERETKLNALLDVLPVGVSILDAERNVSYVNTALGRILDISSEGLFRGDYKNRTYLKPDGTLMPAEEYASARAIKEQKAVHNIQTGVVKEDGNVVWTNVSAVPVAFPDWKVIIVTSDITDRKQAEEKIRESEEKYRLLVENQQDMVVKTDVEGHLLYVNPAYCELFDKTDEELLGTSYTPLVHPDDLPIVEKAVASLFKPPFECYYEERASTRHGWRWLSWTAKAMLDKHGAVSALIGSGRDITERKRAEEELSRSRQEMHALSRRLLLSREEERTSIARELHDELGQALTALKLDLSWLSNKLPREQKKLLEKTRSMSELIDATAKMVRKISTELRPAVLDDLGLVAAIEWQLSEFKKRTGTRFRFTCSPKDIQPNQEAALNIFRILQELLTNVSRHAQATRVTVNLKETAGMVELRIRDDGRGILTSEISSTKSLGLLGIRERTRHHGGDFEIMAGPGKGTTAIVRAPVRG